MDQSDVRTDGLRTTAFIVLAILVVVGIASYLFHSPRASPQRGATNTISQPANSSGTPRQPQ
jgi:hypothetical protein